MYNVRKCPKCGGNVPEGNEVCNNCGHKMRFFGGSSVIVTGSKNANTIPGGNPFESKKSNNSGCLAVILILFFFGLPFISVFYELFQEFSVDINEDDYDIEENKCTKSCGDSAYKEYNNYCFCENGNIYDENGYVEHYYTGVPILDNKRESVDNFIDTMLYYFKYRDYSAKNIELVILAFQSGCGYQYSAEHQ